LVPEPKSRNWKPFLEITEDEADKVTEPNVNAAFTTLRSCERWSPHSKGKVIDEDLGKRGTPLFTGATAALPGNASTAINRALRGNILGESCPVILLETGAVSFAAVSPPFHPVSGPGPTRSTAAPAPPLTNITSEPPSTSVSALASSILVVLLILRSQKKSQIEY
jgi:hypothetical protein